MARDFKQYDYLNYIYCGESFARSGCGATAPADLLYTINKGVDPLVCAEWLTAHGFASPYQGTVWGGVSDCLTYYGGGGKLIGAAMDGTTSSPIFEAFKDHIRSGYMGILLMHKVTSSYWTGGGHYIAIVAHRKSDDAFLVYDPASAARTGWHGWNDFIGNICCLYTSTIRWDNDSEKAYRFEPRQVEYGFNGVEASILEMILYARGLYDYKSGMFDDSCGRKLEKAIRDYQELRNKQGANLRVDGKCGGQTWGDLFGTGKGYIDLVPVVGGSHGLSVLFAQEMMYAYGYYLGRLDQNFGNASIAATIATQKKLGMAQTGVWGYDMYKRVCTKPKI